MNMRIFITAVFIAFCAQFSSAEDIVLGPNEAVFPVADIIAKASALQPDTDKIVKYGDTMKNKAARGEGVVVSVLPAKRGIYRVTVLTDASKPEKGYDVILFNKNTMSAKLQPGDTISFLGRIGRIAFFKGISVDVLGDFTLLSSAPAPATPPPAGK